jgi:putative DNA methylase
MTYRKKLIEVSLPLEAINVESAHEKSIRHGHPSTLHLWWARRPLAACRAVIWSSLVDDPSEYMTDEESANRERDRLFDILEKMVKWENINNEDVLDAAKLEIARSVARDLGCDVPVGKGAICEFLTTKAPPVLDPFAGGGSIPLEAQRLGLRAYASDLNPVAVLINKAMIEIPPKFAGLPPLHPPESGQHQGTFLKKEWKGTEGLAEDVRYYGKWMREEAEKRVGYLYPKVNITAEVLEEREDLRKQGLKPGDQLTVIAWLWARSVKCPNPACSADAPLVRSFWLSKNKNKKYWNDPIIDSGKKKIIFKIRTGNETPRNGTVNRRGATCLVCGSPIPFDYIRSQGKSNRFSQMPMAIVTDSPKSGRVYLPPDVGGFLQVENNLAWMPNVDLPYNPFSVRPPLYGLNSFSDLFTIRQLNILTTLSNLIEEVRILVNANVVDEVGDAKAYGDAISLYLSFCLDKFADLNNSMCIWEPVAQCPRNMYGRQAIAMQWNFPEANPFSESSGSWGVIVDNMVRNLITNFSFTRKHHIGFADAADATSLSSGESKIICTDPPYYNNVDYADLSDFFYVWLRKSLANTYPSLFSTLLVPKNEELVATPYRFDGDKKQAEDFFENGLKKVFASIKKIQNTSYPLTVFYAFKQTETDVLDVDEDEEDITSQPSISTGWETMLEGLLQTKYMILGTWPMRTEMNAALKAKFNSLASSIVLVCRPQPENAPSSTRREFLSNLKREIPPALHQLQRGNIAPVDLAQAAIGPGMAIFSRYKTVLEADGSPMRVRAVLALINQSLDEYLAEQEGEYDGDTRWALAWFEQYGHDQGPYGVAETLSKAKNTSVEGLTHAGFLEARGGKVRLLRRNELVEDWDPTMDKRLTAWESAQYMIRSLDKDGEKGAGALLGKLGSFGETARDLAYRLYTLCERKGWAQEALAYNMLVVAWPKIKEQSGKELRQQSLL